MVQRVVQRAGTAQGRGPAPCLMAKKRHVVPLVRAVEPCVSAGGAAGPWLPLAAWAVLHAPAGVSERLPARKEKERKYSIGGSRERDQLGDPGSRSINFAACCSCIAELLSSGQKQKAKSKLRVHVESHEGKADGAEHIHASRFAPIALRSQAFIAGAVFAVDGAAANLIL